MRSNVSSRSCPGSGLNSVTLIRFFALHVSKVVNRVQVRVDTMEGHDGQSCDSGIRGPQSKRRHSPRRSKLTNLLLQLIWQTHFGWLLANDVLVFDLNSNSFRTTAGWNGFHHQVVWQAVEFRFDSSGLSRFAIVGIKTASISASEPSPRLFCPVRRGGIWHTVDHESNAQSTFAWFHQQSVSTT